MYKKSKFCKHGKKGCRKQHIMIERSLYYVGILPACMHDVVVRYFCIQNYSYTKCLLRNINQKMKRDFRYLSSRKRIGIYEAIIMGRLLCSILQHGGLSLMIVLRMVMAQEYYSLSLHLSLASSTQTRRT